MLKYIFIIFNIISTISIAQIDQNAYGYYDYALRFTSQDNYGSPRMNAFGGASTTLGADYSQHATNPAGLGFYQQNDIGFSFGNDANSFQHIETNTRSFKNQFNINSIGIVLAETNYDKRWKNNAIALSFNRLGSFITPLNYTKQNKQSLRKFLTNSAEGIHFTDLINQLNDQDEVINLYGLAYHTFLINEKNQTNQSSSYFTFSPNESNTIKESIEHVNRNTQYNFSYGGGLEDTYYYGISLGFKNINERKLKEYTETPENGDLNKITYNEEETSKGIGANINLGFIFRPTNELRIGISYQSPTSITLNENYKASLVAEYNNYSLPNGEKLNTEMSKTSPFTTNYTIREPFGTRLGVSYLLKEKLLIAIDGKYTPLQNLKLSSSEFNLDADNRTIKALYTNQYTAAIGLEYKSKQSYLRTGFNVKTTGHKNKASTIKYYSIGLGQYLKQGVFIDLTYAYQNLYSDQYKPYTNAETITTNGKRHSLQFGIHFIIE